jgi:hypothetical protein
VDCVFALSPGVYRAGKMPLRVARAADRRRRYFLLAAVATSVVACNAQIATQATCNDRYESTRVIWAALDGSCGRDNEGGSEVYCESSGSATVGPCSTSESACISEEANVPRKCPPSQDCCVFVMARSCPPDSGLDRRLSDISTNSHVCFEDPKCTSQCLVGAL